MQRGHLSHRDNGNASAQRCSLLFRCIDVVFPWAFSALLGLLTAVTGIYIAWNCDYLSDLRFGRCRGLHFSDRNRCCGGAENIDFSTERCKEFGSTEFSPVEWVPWERAFESRLSAFAVYLGLSVLLSGLAAFLVQSYCPPAKGSGIPDVKAAVSGFTITQSFSAWCLLVKSLGLSLVVGAGLSLGKEGPLIHIGVCWAHVLRFHTGPLGALESTVPLYEIICVGAAAGVSTAFGAPIGGVLFAVEELGSVRALSSRALLLCFAGSFTASFVLKSWNLYGVNRLTFFALSTLGGPTKEWVAWEVFLFVMLGVVGGLIGASFVRLNLAISKRRRAMADLGRFWMFPRAWQDCFLRTLPKCAVRLCAVPGTEVDSSPKVALRLLHVCEAILIASVTAAVNYPFTPLLRLPMVEVIHSLFEGCPDSRSVKLGLCDESTPHGFNVSPRLCGFLLLSGAAHFLQTAITFGAALPSGLFIPSLYIGATVGRLVGLGTLEATLRLLGPQVRTQISPGVFAMVGAVATLSGFARMTVSLVVIMFELTGELTYVVPFMCAVLTAKLVGDSFTDSIYDGHAGLLGFASIEEPERLRLGAIVGDIAEACGDVDVLDVSGPVSLESLVQVLRDPDTALADDGADGVDDDASPFAAPDAACPEVPLSLTAPARLDVLVLVKGDAHMEVLGVVERWRLRGWLEGQLLGRAGGRGGLVSFEAPAVPTASAGSVLRPSCIGLQRQPPPGRVLLDASGILETSVARLHTSAPVLTAVCAFHEHPRLRYCVCRGEADGRGLCVLSRSQLEAALAERKFAAAFYDQEAGKDPPETDLGALWCRLRGFLGGGTPTPRPQRLP